MISVDYFPDVNQGLSMTSGFCFIVLSNLRCFGLGLFSWLLTSLVDTTSKNLTTNCKLATYSFAGWLCCTNTNLCSLYILVLLQLIRLTFHKIIGEALTSHQASRNRWANSVEGVKGWPRNPSEDSPLFVGGRRALRSSLMNVSLK